MPQEAKNMQSDNSPESRTTNRRLIGATEFIACRVAINGAYLSGHIIDMSSWGLGVGLENARDGERFNVGDAVSLAFSPSQDAEEITLAALVANFRIVEGANGPTPRLGLAIVPQVEEIEENTSEDRRVAGRYAVPELICPQAWANHPWFAQDRIYFQVVDVSPYGFTLATTSPHCALLPSMRLPLAVSFPGGPCYVIPVEVSRVSQGTRPEWFHVGVKFQKRPKDFLTTVAEYLLSICRGISIAELRQVGFPVVNLEKSLIYQHISSWQDFKDVLRIRKESQQARKSETQRAVTTEIGDEFDEFSRIFLIRLGDKPVATGKVIFNSGHRDRSALHRQVALPKFLWDAGFAEPTALDILPAFQNWDVYPFVLKNIMRIVYEAGVPYLLMGVSPTTLQHCLDAGAQPLHLSYSDPEHTDTLEVVSFSVTDLMRGVRISPLLLSYEEPALIGQNSKPVKSSTRRKSTKQGKGLPGANDALLLFEKIDGSSRKKR